MQFIHVNVTLSNPPALKSLVILTRLLQVADTSENTTNYFPREGLTQD